MTKHQGQNILMKVIQKTEKQTKLSATANFIPKKFPDNDIAEGINSLNSKQREVFNVVHTWAKDYVKYNGHNVEPVHIFLSGSGGSGKSHLVKVIYNAISKTLLYHSKGPEKPRVVMLGPTEISAVNIGGTTIHSGLGIQPGAKLLGLNDKSKAALRNRLSVLKFLIIDELSMVSAIYGQILIQGWEEYLCFLKKHLLVFQI